MCLTPLVNDTKQSERPPMQPPSEEHEALLHEDISSFIYRIIYTSESSRSRLLSFIIFDIIQSGPDNQQVRVGSCRFGQKRHPIWLALHRSHHSCTSVLPCRAEILILNSETKNTKLQIQDHFHPKNSKPQQQKLHIPSVKLTSHTSTYHPTSIASSNQTNNNPYHITKNHNTTTPNHNI
ncbi:hypothetical protein M758_1G099900 [Ceratodon purpureus]|nr:hypothetical protein M758_1G099900 [Ceratodon purpureus]